jgi:adenylate kinase family enzyme
VKETEPVVKKYEAQGLVIKVNAEKNKEEVYTDLKAQLIVKGYKPK